MVTPDYNRIMPPEKAIELAAYRDKVVLLQLEYGEDVIVMPESKRAEGADSPMEWISTPVKF